MEELYPSRTRDNIKFFMERFIKKLIKFIFFPFPRWILLEILNNLNNLNKLRPALVPIYELRSQMICDTLNVNHQPKLALLSYITTPFRLSQYDPRNLQFSNVGIARSIVRTLNELGYIVDVVEYTDIRFTPKKEYDLFIGHGGHNFKHIASNLPPHTTKIYFSTTLYWREHNNREKERFHLLEERRKVRLNLDRWIPSSEDHATRSADGIICLGNQVTKKSYSNFPLVMILNNAAYHDNRYELIKKDFKSSRNNFLFFAGGGNVHKGLDLLLEAFVQVKAHLYICQNIKPDFYKVYQHELEKYPNIHLKGWVPMRTPQFYGLIDKCAFIIHPSCAEGSPGAIVECMHQGLIPIVSRYSGINTHEYGITLKTCSVDEIVKMIRKLSQHPPEWHEKRSKKTHKAALKYFSDKNFRQNLKISIQHIIINKRADFTR